jgi:hypothetical protein
MRKDKHVSSFFFIMLINWRILERDDMCVTDC